jgi:hypothetical protein
VVRLSGKIKLCLCNSDRLFLILWLLIFDCDVLGLVLGHSPVKNNSGAKLDKENSGVQIIVHPVKAFLALAEL